MPITVSSYVDMRVIELSLGFNGKAVEIV